MKNQTTERQKPSLTKRIDNFYHSQTKRKDSLETQAAFSLILILT